jgi:biopolymer transport protein ExbD
MPAPSINVTPLVDVVLVLLIIFMVVAPKLDQDVAVTLPGVFNADAEAGMTAPLKVSMPVADRYYYEGLVYDLDGLVELLEAVHAADPTRRLVLRADAGIPYGEVRKLQQRAQAIGFTGLSFLVNVRHRLDEGATATSDPP